MEDSFNKRFGPRTLPALLIGNALSVGVQTWVPMNASLWIAGVSGIILVLIAAKAIFLYVTYRLAPRHVANQIYVVDEESNLAVIEHPFFKRIQPCGSRLGYHELPREAISRALRDEIGLAYSDMQIWPPVSEPRKYGDTEIVPSPFQVQVERHKQRFGIREHYDYVYVCRLRGRRPPLAASCNPRWMSLAAIRRAAAHDVMRAPFSDAIPTFEKIIQSIESSRGCQ
jgi:hypothetical protein